MTRASVPRARESRGIAVEEWSKQFSDLLADLEDERLSVVFCATSEVPGASQGTMALKRINKELQVPTRRQLLEIRTSKLQNKTRAKGGPRAGGEA